MLTWKPANLRKRHPNTSVFLCILWNFWEQLFYRTPPVAASDSPTYHLQFLFIDSTPLRALDVDQKVKQNTAQIIIYYHATKQIFPCLSWLIMCLQFQNMFWKNISCFLFWRRTYTKLKDFLCFHFAVDQVLSISGYDLENGRIPCKQKYKSKYMAEKILILILFCFCLLGWLSPVSIVGTICFNYTGPCRWL